MNYLTRKISKTILFIGLPLAVLAGVLIFPNGARAEWQITEVDNSGSVWDISIALDTNNYPHISYYEGVFGDLKYAKWTGSAWAIQTVDSVGDVGMFTSIAIDTNNYPHISYRDATNGDLKYAKWTGSAWAIETVDSIGDVGKSTSIDLDTNNYPHISYRDETNGDLKYAKWTGSAWIMQVVDSIGDVGWDTSLAIDTNNYPHISYWDVTNLDLKYAKWTGSAWIMQTVDSVGDVGMHNSIDLDINNHPHISYRDVTNLDLKYAKWTGSAWAIQIVDSVGDVGAYTSIEIDTNNYPHIAYIATNPVRSTDLDAKYAKWTGSAWAIEIYDGEGLSEMGRHSSLALDTNNNPHTAYRDDTFSFLRYAKWVGAVVSVVSTPSFSPAQGSYTSNQTISISSATSGAVIYYTTDNSIPTTSSNIYFSPLSISSTTTIKAFAVKLGLTNSSIATAIYTITPSVLTSISLSPSTSTVAIGSTQQFTATPKDQFGNTMTGVTITWTSSNTTAAAVNSSGLVTALAQGTTTITASSGGIFSTATATIVAQLPSLIANWKFDENSGSSAADSSGNTYTGTISNATWTAGKSNSALQFDGSTSYIDITKTISTTNGLTIDGWIKPGTINVVDTIFNVGSQSFTDGFAWLYLYNSDIWLQFGTGTTYININTPISLTSNQWSHIAVAHNYTTKEVKFYLNGVQLGSTITYTENTALITNKPSRIGAYSASSSHYFSGAIDEVKIYSRALTSSEILADYNAGIPSPDLPTISISSPTNNQTLSTSSITVSGTASDNIALSKVEVKLNSGTFQLATGTTSWSIPLTLISGSNTITARATDTSNNTKETTITVTYSASVSSNVILWDTGIKYSSAYPQAQTVIANKSNWMQVPYGLTNYTWIGDAIIENPNYYLLLYSWAGDSPDIIAKPGNVATSANEIYKVYDTGSRNFGMGNVYTKILTNTPDEVLVESAEAGNQGGNIVNTYRITKSSWLEVKPVQNMNQQGMHAKTRLGAYIFTDVNKDVLLDARKYSGPEINTYAPQGAIGLMNFHRAYSTEGDYMWFLTFPPGAETNSLTYHGIHNENYWEWDCKGCSPTVGANYAYLNEKVVIGALNNVDNWKREDINQSMTAGQTYTTTFAAPYAGKWRMIGVYSDDTWNIANKASEVTMNAGSKFTFTAPKSGTLAYIVVYLFDRTANTPLAVSTPMDVYRETINLTPPSNTAPSSPQTLTSTSSDASVSLTWLTPLSNGGSAITNYKVYRGTSSNTEIFLANSSVLSYTDSTVTNGTTYYYQVTALNSIGESTRSNETIANPQATKIQGTVSNSSSVPIAGATVTAGSNTTTTNASGFYTLSVPPGIYTITVTASSSGYTSSSKSASVITAQTTTVNFTLTSSSSFSSADLNSDTYVNSVDFGIMMSNWNLTTKPPADINQDGIVNSVDFGIMMSLWG